MRSILQKKAILKKKIPVSLEYTKTIKLDSLNEVEWDFKSTDDFKLKGAEN